MSSEYIDRLRTGHDLWDEGELGRPPVSPGKRTLASRLTAPSIDRSATVRRVGTGAPMAGAQQSLERAAGTSGQALPAALQHKFGAAMGEDLSGVRVHTGRESAQAAQQISARAYTVGRDIHFGPGQYDPSSATGERLLAHEVVHTVQQGGSSLGPQAKLEIGEAGDSFEREADDWAEQMVTGRGSGELVAAAPVSRVQRVTIQRFVTEPAAAAQGAQVVLTAILSASPEELAEITRVLASRGAPEMPDGEGVVRLRFSFEPRPIPVAAVDIDELLSRARSRQGSTSADEEPAPAAPSEEAPTEAPAARAPNPRAGLSAVRAAIAAADEAGLGSIREALSYATYGRAAEQGCFPVRLPDGREVDVAEADIPRLRQEVEARLAASRTPEQPADAAAGDSPPAAGAAAAPPVELTPEQRRLIDSAIDAARDHFRGGEGSVFGKRIAAVQHFVTSVQDESTDSSISATGVAASAALMIASTAIGSVVGAALAAAIAEAASAAVASAMKSHIERMTRTAFERSIAAGVAAAGSGTSIAHFQELQENAIGVASTEAINEFRAGRERFYQVADGLDQANALASAYQRAQDPAYHEQSVSTYAQWARLVEQGDRTGGYLQDRGLSDDSPDGVLTLDCESDGSAWRPTSAEQGGMTQSTRELLQRRQGTLGDLFAGGMTIQLNLVFHGWRPIIGDSVARITCRSSGIFPRQAGTALAQHCNRVYGSQLAEDGSGESVAAHIIWAREFSHLPLSSLPAVG